MNADAHVWVADADDTNLAHLLSAQELERMQQFHFARDRASYATAHALARLALSWCDGSVPPHEWTFAPTAHGRPEIATPTHTPRLRFNISHTRTLVACIVTEERACGIDVEAAYQGTDLLDLARTVLTPTELAQLTATPPTGRPHLFCRYWTAKEAYAKALGVGMALPFTTIECESVRESGLWHFEQWSPLANHIVTTAVQRDGREGRVVRHRSSSLDQRLKP